MDAGMWREGYYLGFVGEMEAYAWVWAAGFLDSVNDGGSVAGHPWVAESGLEVADVQTAY